MPAEEPVGAKRCGEALRGVQHHLDHALDIAVSGLGAARIQAEPPRNRRAHLIGIEVLALDLAGLEDIQRQRLKLSLFLEIEPQPFHPAQQPTLPVPDLGQRHGQSFPVPVEPRPVRQLVDIAGH